MFNGYIHAINLILLATDKMRGKKNVILFHMERKCDVKVNFKMNRNFTY